MAKTLLLTFYLPCMCLAAEFSEVKKFADPDGKTSFGDAVDINGNLIIVGARNFGTQAGAAYIYKLNSNTKVWKEYKLTEAVSTANHYFGKAVCIKDGSNPVAVATTYSGSDGGSAQIFGYNSSSDTWDLKQRISGTDTAGAGAYFGGSCSTDGVRIVVGAHKSGGVASSAGAAYVFKMNTTSAMWTQEAKLQGSDAAFADYFAYPGQSVSIKGDVIICGAKNAGSNGTKETGKAYIFRFQAPTTAAPTTTAPTGNSTGNGSNASNSTNSTRRLMITMAAGAAGNWTEEQILEASDKQASDYDCFGEAVDVDGDVAVVGAPRAKVDGVGHRGKVWIFRRSSSGTWIQDANLTLPQKVGSDDINTNFGSAVAVEGNRVAVGARYYKASALGLKNSEKNCGHCTNSGAVQTYLYSGTAWNTEQIFYASDGGAYELYGSAVGMDGNRLVVGAAPASTKKGQAYLMEITTTTTPAPTQTPAPTSSGSNASGSTSGSTNASESTYAGNIEVAMSKAHADALTLNLTNAKAIFKTAISSVGGVAESKITITKIFKGGVEVTGRRLNSTNSTDVKVRADWELTTSMARATFTAAITSTSTMTNFKTALQTAAANAPVPVTIVVTATPTATMTTASSTGSSNTTLTSAPGSTSGCSEWSVWTSLVSGLVAFFTLA